MTVRTVLFVSILTFSLLVSVKPSAGLERSVGVSAGDWFKYEFFDVSCNSTSCANATFAPSMIGPSLMEANETAWFVRTVQRIDEFAFSCKVVFQNLKHFKNGTEKTENGFVDVISGDGNMSVSVVSANLDANDSLYDDVPFRDWRIADVTIKGYPDGTRETVHVHRALETKETIINETADNQNETTVNGTKLFVSDYYWDRPTGILVEFSYEESERVGDYLGIISYLFRLVESNAFAVPEFQAFYVLSLSMTITLPAIMVYTRKRRLHLRCTAGVEVCANKIVLARAPVVKTESKTRPVPR